MATQFYEKLYKSEGTVGMEEVLSHIHLKVDGAMSDMLNAPCTTAEVKEALF